MKFSLRSKTFVEREFLDFILDKIEKPEIILDLGSATAFQSIEFSIVFPDAKIYAFECNPLSIKKCHENIINLENIEVVDKAVYNKDGFIKFYPILNYNDASSLYKFSKDYLNTIEKFEQKMINLKATRIDTWAKEKEIRKIDLCWLDLQGAEYEAIEGIGDLIYNIQALYIEVAEKAIYNGQKLIYDIKDLLENKGFSMLKYFSTIPGWYGNAIFLNNKLLAQKKSKF
ncbi:MAG: FkbM family methyltransferase [Promethearchaeota archaeon]